MSGKIEKAGERREARRGGGASPPRPPRCGPELQPLPLLLGAGPARPWGGGWRRAGRLLGRLGLLSGRAAGRAAEPSRAPQLCRAPSLVSWWIFLLDFFFSPFFFFFYLLRLCVLWSVSPYYFVFLPFLSPFICRCFVSFSPRPPPPLFAPSFQSIAEHHSRAAALRALHAVINGNFSNFPGVCARSEQTDLWADSTGKGSAAAAPFGALHEPGKHPAHTVQCFSAVTGGAPIPPIAVQ